MAPAPGAFTMVQGKRLRLARVRAVPRESIGAEPIGAPGTVHVRGGCPDVVTGRGSVEILAAQLEGKREIAGRDLVNGRVLFDGLRLGA
jgi:methionyl-tRNA formyltransferase